MLTYCNTERVRFRLLSPEALRAAEKLRRDSGIGASRDQVAALPPGRFVAWNRLSGGSVTGGVF